ncbi:MAG: hypothetical protein J5907_01075 [Bacteroidales bacterium]|nr:hypothetical protein [Bacteroidales bacterium]
MRNKLSSLLLLLTSRDLACGDPEEDTFANFSRLTESHGGDRSFASLRMTGRGSE